MRHTHWYCGNQYLLHCALRQLQDHLNSRNRRHNNRSQIYGETGGEEGFEPSMRFPHTPLAGERLQPLGHLSVKTLHLDRHPRGCKRTIFGSFRVPLMAGSPRSKGGSLILSWTFVCGHRLLLESWGRPNQTRHPKGAGPIHTNETIKIKNATNAAKNVAQYHLCVVKDIRSPPPRPQSPDDGAMPCGVPYFLANVGGSGQNRGIRHGSNEPTAQCHRGGGQRLAPVADRGSQVARSRQRSAGNEG